MRILMLAINDHAGTAIAFANAINRYTPHRCRLITKELRYTCLFEKDLHEEWLVPGERQEVEALLRESDIFHFHMTSDEDTEFAGFRPRDFLAGKLVVHHHHGHPDFRGNPEKYQEKYARRGRKKLLVSTPDLLKLLPGAVWPPNIVPVNAAAYLPMSGTKPLPASLAHSPTRKDLKNTDALVAAVASLQSKGVDLRLELIENRTHKDCLRIKRRSHMVFDHLQGYFGISSLESLSQGLCVIAGLDDWNRRHVLEYTGAGELPWFITSLERLEQDLERLTLDHDLREDVGRRARCFMERFWTEQLLVRSLIDFYES